MIRKLLCFFGFHQWGKWRDRNIYAGYYDQAFWKERKCLHCGEKQTLEEQ